MPSDSDEYKKATKKNYTAYLIQFQNLMTWLYSVLRKRFKYKVDLDF